MSVECLVARRARGGGGPALFFSSSAVPRCTYLPNPAYYARVARSAILAAHSRKARVAYRRGCLISQRIPDARHDARPPRRRSDRAAAGASGQHVHRRRAAGR